MKLHLGLLFVLAGLAMGLKGQFGRPGVRGRQGAGGQLARIPGTGFCPPPFSSCGSCPCCLGTCALSKCIGACKSEKVSDDECDGQQVYPACSDVPLKVVGPCEIFVSGWAFQDGVCYNFSSPGCCATKEYFQTEKQCKEGCSIDGIQTDRCCASKTVGP